MNSPEVKEIPRIDELNEYIERNIDELEDAVKELSYDKNAYYEQINNDMENFKKVESMLNNNNINKNICVINNNNFNICKKNNMYLVEPTITLTNYNLGSIKEKIKSGYIININDDVSLSDYKILLRQIYYQDLSVISLSKLISEERD